MEQVVDEVRFTSRAQVAPITRWGLARVACAGVGLIGWAMRRDAVTVAADVQGAESVTVAESADCFSGIHASDLDSVLSKNASVLLALFGVVLDLAQHLAP